MDVCILDSAGQVLRPRKALAMSAIHTGQAKNDKIASHKIAVLVCGGMLPQAYVYLVRAFMRELVPASPPGERRQAGPQDRRVRLR